MKVALDTNVLVYAEGANGAPMRDAALSIVKRLPHSRIVIPVQALGELYNVLVRKVGRSASRARVDVQAWGDAFTTTPTSSSALFEATGIAATHKLSIWDSVMIAAAAEAGCRLLLSEDLQPGFTWRTVTVANPFSPQLHPALEAVLSAE